MYCRHVGIRKAGDTAACLNAKAPLRVLHCDLGREKCGSAAGCDLAVSTGLLQNVRLGVVARVTRLCGKRKSRTGWELRDGASCANSLAAEIGCAQVITGSFSLYRVLKCKGRGTAIVWWCLVARCLESNA